jgi:hypothetical protein
MSKTAKFGPKNTRNFRSYIIFLKELVKSLSPVLEFIFVMISNYLVKTFFFWGVLSKKHSCNFLKCTCKKATYAIVTTLNTTYTVGSSILWVHTFVYHIFIHFNNFSSILTNFIQFHSFFIQFSSTI